MENLVRFRFYGNLNDFLPETKRNGWLEYAFSGSPAVKDAIEAQGIPHPEVARIFVDQQAVGLSYSLQPEAEIEVWPLENGNAAAGSSLIPELPEPVRFILDVHLGKLARLLRLLGFDSIYQTHFSDQEIARISEAETRLILTRDVGLLKQKIIRWGYWLRSQDPEEQLTEVVTRFGLATKFRAFSRCLACNGEIVAVEKQDVLEQLPPRTRQYYHEFYQCQNCHRVYWKGSHYERMQALVQKLGSF